MSNVVVVAFVISGQYLLSEAAEIREEMYFHLIDIDAADAIIAEAHRDNRNSSALTIVMVNVAVSASSDYHPLAR